MAVTKTTKYLVTAILCLVLICIGLIIGLVVNTKNSATDSKNTGRNDQNIPSRPTVPIVSPVSGGVNDSPSSLQDEDLSGTNWEQDKVALSENESQGGADPSLPWETNLRLPRSVIPNHYDLYLFPDLTTGMFSGNVSIHVTSKEQRDHFLVHSKYLDILSSSIKQNQKEVELLEVLPMVHEKHEFLVFRTKDNVPSGNYTINIDFRGNLTRGIVGFYKSVYKNGRGETVPIATSKFQPTFARRAFPCFDEPSFKSTFTVTLVRPTDGYIALSNMPVKEEFQQQPSQKFTEVKFEKSPPMVTYLACFIVCDFDHKSTHTQIYNTLFRVYATPTQSERVSYALDIGANITDYFEKYFDIKYPLPKQDMIAIPDFVSGAMEHWGLITYRETNLLYDERESSSYNQQRVASVVSHELAHQWFGNLVTLSWWDDLWLNEGFASYMEYKGVANYHTDWNMESQFLTSDLHRVMDLDATVNSHPIVQAVENPDQITEIFDTITYSKGASVLRMLENFMGDEMFRIGVKRFLEKYKYANAVTKDLWRELEAISVEKSTRLNIEHIMDTWTRQMGFPVIQVERVKDGIVRVRQSRYLIDSEKEGKGEESPYGYKWDIYLTYKTNSHNNEVKSKWFTSNDEFVQISVPSGTTWIKFNVDQKGFYRVNYSRKDWKEFIRLLEADMNVLSQADRASLLNDAFSLAESGHLKSSTSSGYDIPILMTKYLKKEEGLIPWETVYKSLDKLRGLLDGTKVYPLLRKYYVSLIEGHYTRLGFREDQDDKHVDKMNRLNILYLGCRNGYGPCLTEAGDRFLAWIKDKSAYIPPNLRNLVYRYGMQEKGDEESWNVMLDRFMNEQNAQEKRKLLSGLAYIREPWILKQFLNLAKNETIVRSQDYFSCLTYISRNPIGNSIVWKFIREEWPYMVDRFSLNDRYLGRIPKTISSGFSTKLELEELKAFFAKYPDAGAGARARKQAIEKVENNIKWLEMHEENIYSQLKKMSFN